MGKNYSYTISFPLMFAHIVLGPQNDAATTAHHHSTNLGFGRDKHRMPIRLIGPIDLSAGGGTNPEPIGIMCFRDQNFRGRNFGTLGIKIFGRSKFGHFQQHFNVLAQKFCPMRPKKIFFLAQSANVSSSDANSGISTGEQYRGRDAGCVHISEAKIQPIGPAPKFQPISRRRHAHSRCHAHPGGHAHSSFSADQTSEDCRHSPAGSELICTQRLRQCTYTYIQKIFSMFYYRIP